MKTIERPITCATDKECRYCQGADYCEYYNKIGVLRRGKMYHCIFMFRNPLKVDHGGHGTSERRCIVESEEGIQAFKDGF